VVQEQSNTIKNRKEKMRKTNRLINEKSPYLLQHAYNPVDWYPWGEEAFSKAKEENKPVFLSIGYSTCHWCHVMEKESFENSQVAELMNNAFISVKVDREERPDIDGIYMTVCQMLTGSGGWPLTIIMTPDKKPFFAGTYFPKENRYGRSGMLDLVQKIDQIWKSRKEDILKSADEITNAVKNVNVSETQQDIGIDVPDKTYIDLSKRYDSYHGGFGNAPKFPTPHNLLFLLRYWYRTKDNNALEMVEKTLTEMRKGGMYDHLGYGFHRYSTDQKWLVPHFEKMLYDQALICTAYLETYQATGNPFFRETAEEILEYVMRDMTSPEGAFYSAEDADSEGEEGKFYLWEENEIRNLLKENADLFITVFNVKKDGNWTDPVNGSSGKTNILHLTESYKELAAEYNLTEEELKKILSELKKVLFDIREKRIHPYKDDKVLTDWNALMISAFAKAYIITGKKEYYSIAEKSVKFISEKLTSGNKLIHRYRDGVAGLPAHLDDYAFFINALLDMYEAGFNSSYLKDAVHYTAILNEEFKDETGGSFFFTSKDGEELITRQKDLYDGAIPSGNSVSILNLLRLGRLTGNIDYERQAMEIVYSFASAIKSSPSAYTYTISALEFALGRSYEIIFASEKKEEELNKLLDALNKEFIPNKVVTLYSPDDHELLSIAPFLNNYKQKENKTTVYVCRNFQCSLPVFTSGEMLEELNK
jgi:uncharacterized protein